MYTFIKDLDIIFNMTRSHLFYRMHEFFVRTLGRIFNFKTFESIRAFVFCTFVLHLCVELFGLEQWIYNELVRISREEILDSMDSSKKFFCFTDPKNCRNHDETSLINVKQFQNDSFH